MAALADSGLEPGGKNIIVDYQNAQGDAANLSTIGDRFLAKQVDLILAIATPAAQSVAAKTGTIPILGTAVTDYVSARLVFSNENPGTNVSGTSDLNPHRGADLPIEAVGPPTPKRWGAVVHFQRR